MAGCDPRLSQRLGRARPSAAAPYDLDRSCGVGAPSGVYRDRTGAAARAEPGADHLTLEHEWRRRAGFVGRQLARRSEGPVGDADTGQVEHRTEMKREAGATRMVAAGGIDEQDIGCRRKGRDCGGEARSLAQGESTGLVAGAGGYRDRDRGDQAVVGLGDERSAGPAAVAGLARALLAASERQEAATDHERVRTGVPWRRSQRRQPRLFDLELRRFRPGASTTHPGGR